MPRRLHPVTKPVSALLALSTALYATAVATTTSIAAQRQDAFVGSLSDPSIDYLHAPLNDPVSALARDIEDGAAILKFDAATGYLISVLDRLNVPVESQVLVYSQTSLQAPMIGRANPRAIYFNDTVAIGWVRGSSVLELASHDPRQGVVFYRLDQRESARPRLDRSTGCLRCHISWDTLAVPGMMVLSTGPDDAAGYATGGVVDVRDPIPSRWGSWYLTGRAVPPQHLGTAITSPPWVASAVDLKNYPTPHSDVVALMVLEHQTHAVNLLTFLGWKHASARAPSGSGSIPRLSMRCQRIYERRSIAASSTFWRRRHRKKSMRACHRKTGAPSGRSCKRPNGISRADSHEATKTQLRRYLLKKSSVRCHASFAAASS